MSKSSNIYEIDPSKPFSHHESGIEIKADRCDLRGGVTVVVSRPLRLMAVAKAIAAAMGFHSANIVDNFPPGHGFAGYDAIDFSFEWEDGTEARIVLYEP